MERIKKALDRAKKQRESEKSTSSDNSEGGGRDLSKHTSAVPEDEQNIRYSSTKVIDISERALKNQRVITGIGPGPVTDAYRMLRTKVLQRMRQNDWNALAVTSTTPGEGKSLTAVNLAISLAMEVNQTVLLVDFDLRRPSIHNYFGYKPEKGLSDYLLTDTPLNEILFNPSIERLVVLPGNKPFLNSSEMISSPKMIQMVEDIKSRYPSRLVIFDLPPLLSTDDALAFSPFVEAILMVVEEGKTQAEDLQRAAEMLKDYNLIGTVLNKSDEQTKEYYY
ncbi:MAG: hypothetical protein BMS9Abin26_2014 [Gammaproteobacteria bacterium]|nr:MAG: hypothetical protein BMS9Abin26_2014 [Gammaproteobacteria bacterium]